MAQPGFERRPLVCVEDHLYHTTEMLTAIRATRPDLLAQMTICAIDRPGPDTDATVAAWLTRYPELQVIAPGATGPRTITLSDADLANAPAFARLIANALRRGGILVQDVQLSTLPFVPADRWWESIYVGSTVRGIFADRPPAVRFLSNKRGYSATFGRDLLDAGFDPRDVMDKSEMASVVVPAVAALVDRGFPKRLDALDEQGDRRHIRVSTDDGERRSIEDAFDIVLWQIGDQIDLGGRIVGSAGRARVPLKVNGHEAATWRALVADRLHGGGGIEVLAVGERVGPPDAERAELTNAAARHIHTLRSRLSTTSAIATIEHRYRLGDGISVATLTNLRGAAD